MTMLILALLAAMATDEVPGTNTITTTAPPPPPPVSAAAVPRPMAGPHSCVDYQPPIPLMNQITGRDVFAFTIDENGRVKDLKITTPSGDPDLDEATLACVVHWRYEPPKKPDGTPAEMPWRAQVIWSKANWRRLMRLASPPCAFDRARVRAAETGTETLVHFTIKTDGTVRDPEVTGASSDPALDQMAADCFLTFRFEPVMDGDTPTEYGTTAVVRWAPFTRSASAPRN